MARDHIALCPLLSTTHFRPTKWDFLFLEGERSLRSLMYDLGPVHDDVTGQDFIATMKEWCRVRSDKKADRYTAVLDRDSIYLRQRYMNSVYQKAAHTDLCNLGMKVPPHCRK